MTCSDDLAASGSPQKIRHTKTGAGWGRITIDPVNLAANVRSRRVEAIGTKPSGVSIVTEKKTTNFIRNPGRGYL